MWLRYVKVYYNYVTFYESGLTFFWESFLLIKDAPCSWLGEVHWKRKKFLHYMGLRLFSFLRQESEQQSLKV